MQTEYTTKIENNQLIVSRDGGLATLRIINRLSEAFVDNMTEETPNPLVEFANDLQSSIDNGRLCLTLVGHDNVITFSDEDHPILEGGVYLQNVQINNPYLTNCKLVDVDLKNSIQVTARYSKINGLFMETLEPVFMVSCYVNDKFGLDLQKNKPYRFLMNKFAEGN